MAGVVDGEFLYELYWQRSQLSLTGGITHTEFGDFVDKLEAGRQAWEAFASRTDEAFSQPLALDFALPLKPRFRRGITAESISLASAKSSSSTEGPAHSTPSTPDSAATAPPTIPSSPVRASAVPIDIRRARPGPLRVQGPRSVHGRQASNTSSTSASPLSPSFFDSVSSATTNFSAFSASQHSGSLTADSVTLMRYGNGDPLGGGLLSTSAERAQRSICGGACMLGTAMCEVCSAAQRRGSLGNAFDDAIRQLDDPDEDEEEEELHLLDAAEEANLWPPHPFQYVSFVTSPAGVVACITCTDR